MQTNANSAGQGSNTRPLLCSMDAQARHGDAAALPYSTLEGMMGDRKTYQAYLKNVRAIRDAEAKSNRPAYLMRALLRAERQAYAAEVGLVAITAQAKG